jgi:proteic killer suppression protein
VYCSALLTAGRGHDEIDLLVSLTTDNCHYICSSMIRRFEHRGLKLLYDKDDRRGVSAENVEKTARVLARLDVVTLPEQLRLPGFGLHRLEGDLAGYWTIAIRGDWRIIFRFDAGDITDVDLVEYH